MLIRPSQPRGRQSELSQLHSTLHELGNTLLSAPITSREARAEAAISRSRTPDTEGFGLNRDVLESEGNASRRDIGSVSTQIRRNRPVLSDHGRKNTDYCGGAAAADSISDRSGGWVPHGCATTAEI